MSTPAIVVGSGRSVWADLRAINQPDLPVFAVNEMIQFSPRADHAVSHHASKLPHWLALRPGPTDHIKTHTHGRRGTQPGVQGWREMPTGGSSSLLAVRVAMALGFAPILVAGVPLDGQGYVWGDPATPPATDHAQYRHAWEQARDLKGSVFSPSGFLRDLLGAG